VDEHEIRVVTRVDERGWAIVEVRDSGAGIDPEIARRAFEPFFTTKPVGVGTGLGLFICRNIVVAAGGTIGIEPGATGGTVVAVALPPASDGPAAGALPSTGAVAPPAPRGRILIVDDEPAIRAAVQRMLRREHDVEQASNARHALEQLQSGERFDAIVCDLMMPSTTGMELHAELTRLGPDQARRMIFMTGGAFTPEARRFVEGCESEVLEKPLDAERLRAAVRRVVAGSRPGAA
jgi:CheY-like chemotaxis protein